jgi:methylase of polypeptide subunit release factors
MTDSYLTELDTPSLGAIDLLEPADERLAELASNLNTLSTPSGARMRDPLDRSPLAELLAKAIAKKPHDTLFALGHKETLDAVKKGGDFKLPGLDLRVPAGVYPPRPGSSTEFFCRNWLAAGLGAARGTLLDLGCGSGALTLYAARQGWRATGADIDEVAVCTGRDNALRNGIEAEFVHSNLFAAFEHHRFDAILFNQPFVHKPSVRAEERALASAGGEITRRFLDQAADHLEPGGTLVFSYSNCSDDRLLDRSDWSFEMAACDYESRGQYWRLLIVAKPA